MGLRFNIVQGLVNIIDSTGNIVDTVLSAAKRRLTTQAVIAGSNAPYYECEVDLINGRKKLLTDATVTVEQIFGQDNYPDNWFWIDYAGAINDTVRIQIAGFIDPTGVELSQPAVDVTVTLTSLEAGKEIVLRDKIISTLNLNINFKSAWKATAIKDNPIVHISSKFIAEYGERLTAGSFAVTSSGTTVTRIAYDNVKRRGKPNSGQRDPSDRRLVTVGVSGEVTTTAGAVGDLFSQHVLLNGTGSDDLRVNGSITPQVFTFPVSLVNDIYIKELRFFGNANGIKFGYFLNQAALTNGVLVQIKSDDKIITFDPIQYTDDFKHEFSFGPGAGFQLHVQAGRDDFLSAFSFESPFPLRKAVTFATDDYVKVTIRDNLSSGLLLFQFLTFGFEREV